MVQLTTRPAIRSDVLWMLRNGQKGYGAQIDSAHGNVEYQWGGSYGYLLAKANTYFGFALNNQTAAAYSAAGFAQTIYAVDYVRYTPAPAGSLTLQNAWFA